VGQPAEQQDKVRKELQGRNLGDAQQVDFGKTRYSERLGIMDPSGVLAPAPVFVLLFAVLPHRIVTRERERQFLDWMDSNKRRYEPAPLSFFLPSPSPDRIGKAHVWHDGQRQKVPPGKCYTRYAAVEPDGYVEYGFYPIWDSSNPVYYAQVTAGFVAFLWFLRDLCGQFGLDPSAVSVGLALRGIKGKVLQCITKRVMPHFQSTTTPMQDGFLFFRQATPGTDWTIDEVALEAAERMLDLWSYSVPSGFGTPEFKAGQYEGEYFKNDFRSW
jgi:hypothetical protein